MGSLGGDLSLLENVTLAPPQPNTTSAGRYGVLAPQRRSARLAGITWRGWKVMRKKTRMFETVVCTLQAINLHELAFEWGIKEKEQTFSL